MVCLLAVSVPACFAAEIHLHDAAEVDGAIVRLGDVAEVTAPFPTEAEVLAAIELFPAPMPKESRYVRSREVIDLLVRRGVDFSLHQISGASSIHITRAVEARAAARTPSVADAENRLSATIRGYLLARLAGTTAAEQVERMKVKLELTDEQAELVAGAEQLHIAGGKAPWTDEQRLTVQTETRTFEIVAEVTVPTGLVVAARELPRGSLIRQADLRVEYDLPASIARVGYQSMAPVVGKETTTPIGEGRPVVRSHVREPIVLTRGDAVTVYVRNGGITVRTGGKARADASRGEVVEIESREDRDRRFFARATGTIDPQTGLPTVEVFGNAARLADPPTPGLTESNNQIP